MYPTDLFTEPPVGVPVGDALRARYIIWLSDQAGLTEPLAYLKAHGMPAEDAAMAWLNGAMMKHIEETLSAGPYLLGERFTSVGVLYMSLFEHARALLGASPPIDAYWARAHTPARWRAIAQDRL